MIPPDLLSSFQHKPAMRSLAAAGNLMFQSNAHAMNSFTHSNDGGAHRKELICFNIAVVSNPMNMSKDGPGLPAPVSGAGLGQGIGHHSFEKMSFASVGGSGNGMQCRICLESISLKGDEKPEIHMKNGVTSPCKCAGSVKLIHIRCLKEWIKAKGSIQCEICHSLYSSQWIEWAFEKNYIK